MYTITWGASVVYDDTLVHDKEYQLIDFNLKIEDNKAGSLTMIVPPTNRKWNDMVQYSDERRLTQVYANGQLIWSGRSVSTKIDIFKRLEVFCEGAMSWLGDVLYTGCPALQSSSSAYKIETGRQKILSIVTAYDAKIGSDPIVKTDFQIKDGTSYMQIDGEADSSYKIPACPADTTKTCLQRLQDVLKTYGGHFFVRWDSNNNVFKLDWYAHEWGNNAQGSYTQTADFGENLLDYVKTVSMDEVYTVIRPYGEIADNAPKTETVKTNLFADTSAFQNSYRIDLTGEVVSTTNTNYNVVQVTVDATKKYYYSGHMRGNFSLFSVQDKNNVPLYVKTNYGGNPPDNTKPFEHKDVEIPLPEGAAKIYACFWQDATYESEKSVTLIDYSNVAWITAVSEQNKDAYRVTIADVNNGRGWLKVSNSLFNLYGWIEKRVYFAGINQPQALLNAAEDYLFGLSMGTVTLEVNFIDLALFGVLQPLKLYDGVRVQSAIGEQVTMYVSKIEIRKNPANSKVTLGAVKKKGISSLV